MTQEGGFHINWYKSDNYAVHDNTVSYAISVKGVEDSLNAHCK